MNRPLHGAALLAATALLVACEKPPPESVQRGPRGTQLLPPG